MKTRWKILFACTRLLPGQMPVRAGVFVCEGGLIPLHNRAENHQTEHG